MSLYDPPNEDENVSDQSHFLKKSGWVYDERAPFFKRFPTSIWLIIANEGCERFCFYGLRAILVIYLTHFLKFSEPTAVAVYAFFTVACYLSPLFGGWLSDSRWGKYKTILRFSIVYCLGGIVLAFTALPGVTGVPPHWWGLAVGLTLISIGTGGIKPVVSTFGADQCISGSEGHQADEKGLTAFFHAFYFSINFGSFISTILTPILREYAGFAVAFAVPVALLLLALFLFWLGRKQYVHNPPAGSMLTKVWEVIVAALQTPKTAVNTSGHWLDRAQGSISDTSLIQDTKALLRVLKIFTPLPVFWAIYDQQGSRWTLQAEKMNRVIGSVTIQPEQVQALNAALILVFIPLFNEGIYPGLSKIGFHLSHVGRMMAGMVLGALSFVVAGFVQLGLPSHIHVAWQIPQYVLVTAAEILVSITGLEFAYSHAPVRMKSVVMALYLCTTAIGDSIVGATASLALFANPAWDYFFFAALMGVFVFIFYFIARSFEAELKQEATTYTEAIDL